MSGALSLGRNTSKSKPRDLTPGVFKDLRPFVANQLQQGARGNVPGIEGPFAAPLTAQERGSLSDLNQATFGQGIGQDQEAFIRNTLAGVDQNPFLEDTINAAVRPIIENEELNELRQRSGFTQAGQKIQSSSAFAEDRARSLRDTERQVADTASRLAFQDQQQRQAMQLEAANLANARLQEMRDTVATLALPRLVEQLGIEGANQELARRFQVIENQLLALGQLSAPTIAQKGGSEGFSVGTSGGFMNKGGTDG